MMVPDLQYFCLYQAVLKLGSYRLISTVSTLSLLLCFYSLLLRVGGMMQGFCMILGYFTTWKPMSTQ